jgi:hypothetical protein
MSDSAEFGDNADPAETLTHFAANLLRLLLGERSLAINRAAISELGGAPELSEVLLAQGRHRTGPIVEAYLARLAGQGRLAADDPAEAFGLLYGLVVRDLQIRALLGERVTAGEAIAARARVALEQFLTLTDPGG